MTLREIIATFRPMTLAGVVADVEELGSGATADQLNLARLCEQELENIVGHDEAQMMLEQME